MRRLICFIAAVLCHWKVLWRSSYATQKLFMEYNSPKRQLACSIYAAVYFVRVLCGNLFSPWELSHIHSSPISVFVDNRDKVAPKTKLSKSINTENSEWPFCINDDYTDNFTHFATKWSWQKSDKERIWMHEDRNTELSLKVRCDESRVLACRKHTNT